MTLNKVTELNTNDFLSGLFLLDKKDFAGDDLFFPSMEEVRQSGLENRYEAYWPYMLIVDQKEYADFSHKIILEQAQVHDLPVTFRNVRFVSWEPGTGDGLFNNREINIHCFDADRVLAFARDVFNKLAPYKY